MDHFRWYHAHGLFVKKKKKKKGGGMGFEEGEKTAIVYIQVSIHVSGSITSYDPIWIKREAKIIHPRLAPRVPSPLLSAFLESVPLLAGAGLFVLFCPSRLDRHRLRYGGGCPEVGGAAGGVEVG